MDLESRMKYFERYIDKAIQSNDNAKATIEEYKMLFEGYNLALLDKEFITDTEYSQNVDKIRRFTEEKMAMYQRRIVKNNS